MHAIAFNLFRYNSILFAAALVTLLLFYFMQLLIQTGENINHKISVIEIMDASVPEFERELIVEIDRPEPLVIPPENLEPPPVSLANPGSLSIPVPAVVIDEPPAPETTVLPSNNLMVPLIRTAPNYPARALSRGVEGFVELSFTVNELGQVVDPIVLNAQPEGYFERAALQSIQRWRYTPTTEGGIPVPTYDVRQRIVFQMDSPTQ